jgi:exodeoxyribonuclease VII large subunit
MPKEQISLSELNHLIKATLEQSMDPFYWVVAEIGEIRLNPRGHCYMELVEKEKEEIRAKIKANIWAFTYRKLSGWFEAITKESLKPGMKILCQVQVQFHPIYGLSLNVKDLDPNYTLGERARNRQEVIDTLIREGVYDMNKQWVIPEVVQNIAIISSETAAGYGDFMNQIRYNDYGYVYQCTLFKAIQVQGSSAPSDDHQYVKILNV